MPRNRSRPDGVRRLTGRGRRAVEEVSASDRRLDVGQTRHRPAVEHLPAELAGPGSDVDDPVGAAHHVHVVLDHEQRIARPPQPIEHVEQRFGIGGVQSRRRLVEHVEHAEQPGTQLSGQPQPLQFARRHRRSAAIQASR